MASRKDGGLLEYPILLSDFRQYNTIFEAMSFGDEEKVYLVLCMIEEGHLERYRRQWAVLCPSKMLTSRGEMRVLPHSLRGGCTPMP